MVTIKVNEIFQAQVIIVRSNRRRCQFYENGKRQTTDNVKRPRMAELDL